MYISLSLSKLCGCQANPEGFLGESVWVSTQSIAKHAHADVVILTFADT